MSANNSSISSGANCTGAPERRTSRVELLKEVWGYESDVVSRTLDTHVANLRGKLERDPAVPRHILTVRKTGYRLQA
jgi:DNA-binding response OmpR family regulator